MIGKDVSTVARQIRDGNRNCHVKTCTRCAGTNMTDVSVKICALSATRKAYGVIRVVGTTVCQVLVIL